MIIEGQTKKLGLDFIINIIASSIMTMVLQLIIYPLFSCKFTAAQYGTILTIMGIINTFVGTAGNALNNVRLVKNDKYKYDENGDFNLLLMIGTAVSLIACFAVLAQYTNISFFKAILLGIVLYLGILRTYYSVSFRIVLNFHKILYCNLCISIGYLLGALIVVFGGNWIFVFIVGEIAGLLYLTKTSFVIGGGFTITSKFKESANIYKNFAAATLISNAITYLDRLFIMPVLGANNVAIYSVASVFGKTVGMAMLPIAGVLLGYFAQKEFKMDIKVFNKIAFVSFGCCALFYVVTLIIGKEILKILYPNIINEASPYLAIANLSAIIAVYANMISPVILKYGKSYWQMLVNIVYGAFFCGFGFWLSNIYGLLGFCYAALIANSTRAIIYCMMGWRCINEI